MATGTRQYNLGTFYEAGIGTARDAEQAKHWYIAAARQGQDEALEKPRRRNQMGINCRIGLRA